MSSASGEVLRLEALERRIRGRPILRGVSLEVAGGEVVGLLGPNGAGKTTTFRLVAGLDPPASGRVLLRGEDLGRMPLHLRARAGLGYLPQEPSVFRGLSVLDNVALVLEMSGEADPRGRARSALDELRLGHLAGQKAGTLSGGERRRLELARALVRKPAVLVCDEPLTGVDPMAAAELRELLRALAAKGVGVLLTDHNVGEALRACDRAALLVDGLVVEQGSSERLAASKLARSLYFGEPVVPGR